MYNLYKLRFTHTRSGVHVESMQKDDEKNTDDALQTFRNTPPTRIYVEKKI